MKIKIKGKLIIVILLVGTIGQASLKANASSAMTAVPIAAETLMPVSSPVPVETNLPDTKIIITATDNDTNSSELRYAINTKQEAAFTKNNVFDVKMGNSYIAYVKDQAGNITSKKITVSDGGQVTSSKDETAGSSDSGININATPVDDIDIIKNTPANSLNESNNSSASYSKVIQGDGTVIDTSGVIKEEGKEFYTIQTKDEHIFFLVIDHDQGQDNVYFLDKVTEHDLASLSGAGAEISEKKNNNSKEVSDEDEANFLEGTQEETTQEVQLSEENPASPAQGKATNSGNIAIILIISIIGGGVYYYFKIYKPKQKLADLDDDTDLDDFEVVDDESIEFKQETEVPILDEEEHKFSDTLSVLDLDEEDEFDEDL